MDTSTPPPPPPPQSSTVSAVNRDRGGWWRRPVADLVDLTVLGGAATAVGFLVASLVDDPSDPWAGLAAALLGLAAAGGVLLVGWVVLLVAVHRGRRTPGERLVGVGGAGRVLVAAGRHVALVVGLWAAAGALIGLTEPPPDGLVGSAVAAVVAAGALVLAYGWGPPSVRLTIVASALFAGGALAGAVPDRAPHPWELRDTAETALVSALEADAAATRVCPDVGAAPGTVPAECVEPDRVWTVAGRPGAVAQDYATTVRDAVGEDAVVRVDPRHDEIAITIDGDVVVVLSAPAPACTPTRLVLGRYDVRPDSGEPGCR